MQEVLMEKLHRYMVNNNPDLLIRLQQDKAVSTYLKDKVAAVDVLAHELLSVGTPAYLIEERCMDELTKELRPSKFNYLSNVLEEEFTHVYYQLVEAGLLTYEIINLIERCTPVFETIGFTVENEDDHYLRYAVTGIINEYLQSKQ